MDSIEKWENQSAEIEALRAENAKLRKQLEANNDFLDQAIPMAEELEQKVAATKLVEDELKEKLASTEAHNRMLREALEKFDALIQYQYTGSRAAMSALQEAAFAGLDALSATPQDALDAYVRSMFVEEGKVIEGYEDRIVHWRDGFIPSLGTTLYRLLPSNLMNEVEKKEAK